METLEKTPSIESANYPEKAGIQGAWYAFHHGALERWLGADTDEKKEALKDSLACYKDHDALMAAMTSGEIDFAIIAVDNNNSGRVTTAIEALRNNPTVRILGKIAIEVEQHALLWEGHSEDDIEQAITQKPALDQTTGTTTKRKWATAERSDTAASANEVAEKQGMIENATGKKVPTAAIGPKKAGLEAGLKIGNILSPEGNATTFWVITTNPEKYKRLQTEAPTHAAFTFSVPDREGGLLDAVSIFSDNNFDFTDIDCHLASKGKENGTRSFFAEVRLGELSTEALFSTLAKQHGEFDIDVLGIYADRTSPDLHTTVIHHEKESVEKIHEQWNGREGHNHIDGSPVLYAQGTDRNKLLQSILSIIRDAGGNVLDMSRPLMPPSNGSRGFFLHFAKDTDISVMQRILMENGYAVESYVYDASADALSVREQ